MAVTEAQEGNKMKKILLIITLILTTLFCGCAKEEVANENLNEYPFEIITSKDVIEADIILKNGKTISLELYPEIAPITVSNFVYLAKDKYYDGLIFHRVIEGFMIQGGCPNGIGNGGPNYRIKGEFLANGVENNLEHTRGVISMARSKQNDSAGSQFFIMHKDAPHLDGQYAAFGRVVDGIDAVDEIATTPTDQNDKPLTDVVIETIVIK